MSKNTKNWMGIAALLWASHTCAGEVSVNGVWARATVPGQEVGMVGLVITSQKDASLIAVSSPASNSAEVHTMTMEQGVMKMRQLDFLPLPAKEAVTLGPGGNHLMLIGLKKPLTAGESVSLTITVAFADKRTEKIEMKAKVRALNAGAMPSSHAHH